MQKLDYEKYKAAFSYMLKKLGSIEGKKKACKLFYFLDFDNFEKYGKPFTGEIYLKYQMGPFPKYFEGMVDEMQKEGLIDISKEKKFPQHLNDTIIYKNKKDVDYKFTEEETAMLDRIVRIYGAQNGKMLEELTHSQAPWLAVDFNEEIPYEFSYYRGTEDLAEA